MSLPLAGLRVLSVESTGAAPYGSMYLADLGAEVIKLEDPGTGGDAGRQTGPHTLGESGDSQYFQSFNRNKQSLAIDLKHPRASEVLHRVVGRCDAVLNNLRGDVPGRLGLTYDALKAANPQVVCVHLSAYGRDNVRQRQPGYDFLMQAEAGFMSVTGEPDGPPARMGLSIIDYITGLTAAVALLSGVHGARRSGVGCDMDTALFDVALHQLAYVATWYLNEGTVVSRLPRSAHPSLAPTQLFRAADGWLMVMCMKDKFWEVLTQRLGRPELVEDPRFASMAARRENLEALTAILDTEFGQASTAEWVERLADVIPVAPVLDVAEALDNPFVEAVGMIDRVPHPARPDFRTLSNPLKVNGQRLPARPCGALGADTEAVLGRFGFATGEIAALQACGAVSQHQPAPEDSLCRNESR